MDLLLQIKQRAKKLNKNIVLPETNDDRILKAADIILKEKLAQITLLGNKQEIIKFSQKMDLENIEEAIFVDPFDSKNKEKYGNL
ncbi:MAG: phosphate acetyltransferase, phosphate acetyltransferase, partial [Candidatus Peregrinibacteria bacterium GW2011_GWF2_33_10]